MNMLNSVFLFECKKTYLLHILAILFATAFYPIVFAQGISDSKTGKISVVLAENFEGIWELDTMKSSFNNVTSDAAPVQLKVNHGKDSITIYKFFVKANGNKNSYSESFTFDGKATERIIPSNTRRLTSLLWNVDKSALTFNSRSFVNRDGSEWEYTSTEVWTLSKDGKLLTIQKKTVIPDRIETYKALYKKQ